MVTADFALPRFLSHLWPVTPTKPEASVLATSDWNYLSNEEYQLRTINNQSTLIASAMTPIASTRITTNIGSSHSKHMCREQVVTSRIFGSVLLALSV